MTAALVKKLLVWLGLVLLAMALASLVWSILLWRYPLPTTTISIKPTSAPVKSAWLTGLEDFWVVGELTPQIININEPISTSSLAVQVQGVLFSNHADRSVALLNYRNKDLTLSVGDKLADGILLVAIKYDALVFNRNGQLEQVILQLDKPANLEQKSDLSTNKAAKLIPKTPPNNLANQISEQRVGSRVLEETFGPEFRESLVSDPLQLMSYISISPSSKDGQLQGFILQPGSKPELFKHFGLQAGDLLIAVDGNKVNDTSAMMQLHSHLATAEALDIDLLRGDEHLRIRIEME